MVLSMHPEIGFSYFKGFCTLVNFFHRLSPEHAVILYFPSFILHKTCVDPYHSIPCFPGQMGGWVGDIGWQYWAVKPSIS